MGKDATEDIAAQLLQQGAVLKQLGEAVQQLMNNSNSNAATARTSTTPSTAVAPKLDVNAVDILARGMDMFAYEEDMDATFDRWYERHRTVFEKDAVGLTDEVKVRLLLKKLDPITYGRYANLLLPVKPEDLSLSDTKSKLDEFFGRKESLFSIRRRCLTMRRGLGQDLQGFAADVNREVERIEVSNLTTDGMKCLIFACGLDQIEDQSLRKLILEKMEKDPSSKLTDLLSLCQRFASIKADASQVDERWSSREINMLRKKKSDKPTREDQPWRKQQKDRSSRSESDDEDELQCWNCLGPHMAKSCTRRQMECYKCGRLGHRKQFCSDARRSQRPAVGSLAMTRHGNRDGNRCYAQMEVNGRPTKLLVDTGADVSVITKKTWHNLGSPKLQGGVKAADGVDGSLIKLKGSFTCSFRQSSRKEKHHGRCYVLKDDHGLDVMGNGWLATLGYMEQLKSRLNGKSYADQRCAKKAGRGTLKLSREGNRYGLPQTGTKSLPKQYGHVDRSRKKERALVPKKVGRWNRQPSNLTPEEERQLGQAAHVNTVLRSSINGDHKQRSQEAVTPKTRNEVLQRKSEAVSQNVSELKIQKGRNAKPAVNDKKPRQTRTPKSRADQREDGLRVNTLFTLSTSKDSKIELKPDVMETMNGEISREHEDLVTEFWKGLWKPADKVQLSNLTFDGNDDEVERAVYEDRMDTGPERKQVRRTRKTPPRTDQGKKAAPKEVLGSMDSPSGGGVE